MKLSPCSKCQGESLWHLRAIHEQGSGPMPAELAPSLHALGRGWKEWAESSFGVSLVYGPKAKPTATGNGHFELLICRGCGHCRWFISGARVEPEWIPVDVPCLDCGNARCLRIEHVEERTGQGTAPMQVLSSGRGRGHFSVTVCTLCGRALWFASDFTPPRPGLWAALFEERRAFLCQGCGHGQAWHLDEYREIGEHGTTPLHVLLWRERGRFHSLGRFAVDVCSGCGRAEWLAREIEQLAEDQARGVSAVDLTRGLGGGPYR